MTQCTGEGLSRHAIIQGGMGIGVSSWRLASAVSRQGQIGVVSGTALSTVLVRRLQDGDPDGSSRRALRHCPLRVEADALLHRYWIPGGRPAGQPYRLPPLYTLDSPRELTALTIMATFVEVFLAKEGHDGVIGINLLEKLQLPTLPSLFGAMLAGVDCVLMGAGIPSAIPGVLDRLAAGTKAELRIAIDGISLGDAPLVELNPADYVPSPEPALSRPAFLAIVSSSALATMLARKATGRVTASSLRATLQAVTTPRRVVPPRTPRAPVRSMVRAMSPTSTRSAPSACRSGWPAPTHIRKSSPQRGPPVRPGCKSEPPLPFAKRRGWRMPSSRPCL
jgi:NAD(P)H-dependent flavin oxidoreductase YrpB (nitropropane dioxygenase family)